MLRTLFRQSLRKQLVLSLGMLSLIPLLGLLLAAVPVFRHVAFNRALADLQERAQVLSLGVGLVLDEALGDVMYLAGQYEVRHAFDSREDLGAALSLLGQRIQNSKGRLLAFRLVDPDGQLHGSVGESTFDLPPVETFRSWLSAHDTGERADLWVSEVQSLGVPGLFAVQLAVPVSSGTHLNGYVIGTYDAYRLAAQAVEMRVDEEGRAGLITSSGRLIHSRVLRDEQAAPTLLDPAVLSGARTYTGPLTAADPAGHLVAVSSVGASRASLAMLSLNVPFSVFVAVPRSAVLSYADSISRTVVSAGIVLIGVLCLAVGLLAKGISRPLYNLIAKVHALGAAQQDAADPVTPEASRDENEVQQLDAAFDSMAQRVQEQQRRLRAHNEEMQGMLERLHRADQLKDEFLSFFSHELRTPLSAIRSFAELLRITGDIEEEDRKEFLTIIESECERLTRLSTDLLDLAKIESGDMPWRERVLRPHDFLQPALKTLKVLAEKGGVHLMLQHDAVLPRIVADVDRLTQVVTNLVSNALKFTPPGGQVTVRATGGRRADGTPVLGITVQDTGPGIPQEYLERVFDRYVQAPDTQAGNVRGTGLGLTICKRVVQHYSGTIQAANHPNGGALFHITLPACEPPGTEPDGVDTLERLEAQSVGARADAQ